MKLITAPLSSAGSDSGDECPLASRLALRLIRVYKILISPYFAGSCRFLPSCADYASEAVARYGAGVKITNLDQFERKKMDGKVLITRKDSNERISGMLVKLSTD